MNTIKYLHSDGEEEYWKEVCKTYVIAKKYLTYLENQ